MRVDVRASRGRWVERALAAFGILCLAYYGYQTAEAHNFQRRQSAAFEALLDGAPVIAVSTSLPAAADTARRTLPDDGSAADGTAAAGSTVAPERTSTPSPRHADEDVDENVMALLDIPRLKVSSVVMSGDGDDVLDVAVGHLPDTPKPWEPGNSALAAHRDGLFRPLRNIRVGDEVRVRSTEGELVYRVRETRVVTPDDLSVLAPTETQTLTLITCYPFNYVGNAPKRFIVHAERTQ